MPIERTRSFGLRISDEERAKLERLAQDEDIAGSALIRRWIRQRYEVRFGDEVQPAKRAR